MHLSEGFSEGYKKKVLISGVIGPLITSLKKRFKTSYVQCSSANQNTFELTHFRKTSKHRKKSNSFQYKLEKGGVGAAYKQKFTVFLFKQNVLVYIYQQMALQRM